jgi:uncharacterized protein with GYD domain
MATYVSLISFTQQGAQNFQDTPRRAAAFRDAAKKAGVTVREIYWTLGAFDGLLVLEAPDEQTVTAAMLGLASLGNVRTQTLRAFDESEIGSILERVPRPGASGAQTGGGGGAQSGGASASRGRGKR